MVNCKGLKSISNDYTAVKQSAHTPIADVAAGVQAFPVHADAGASAGGPPHADAATATAVHAVAGSAEATRADAAAASAKHADAALAEASHADAALAEASHAGASNAASAGALHAGASAAGLAVDAVASNRSSDGEYGVGADAGIGAAEERLSTRVCEVVPTNEDGGVVCHLRSLLSCTLKQRAQAGVGRVASPLVSRRRAGSGPAPSHEVPPPRDSYSILPEGGPAHQANELFIETFLTNFRELRNHDVARQLALGRSKRARTAGRAAGLRWVLCARYARTGA